MSLAGKLPKTEEEFFNFCRYDPRFFLEICTLIRLETGAVKPWLFNPIQLKQHLSFYDYPHPHYAVCSSPNTITLKTRQYGETTRELGDMYWAYCFHPLIAKVITFRDETAKKLKLMVDLFDESAHDFFASLGMDPDEWLPYSEQNMHEMFCKVTRSRIEFTSEAATGQGRAQTVNRIYGTEYSLWDDPEEAMSGYAGSLAKTSARVHLDFTGQGIGNEAYREYQAAKRGDSVYEPRFYGRNDFLYDPVTGLGYTQGFLASQRKRLKYKFIQEYPATDGEAFLTADDSRFDTEDIFKCGDYDPATGHFKAQYFSDSFGDPIEWKLETFAHGCDPAEGIPTGSKTAITTRHVGTGGMACPPFNDFLNERDTAFEIRRRLELYPGVIGIESNNHGHAVILKCQDLELRRGRYKGEKVSRFLYKHPIKNKIRAEWKYGWPETKDTKSLMEIDYHERLSEGEINQPCEELRTQLREYCRRDNGTTGRPTKGERRGGRRVSYDDLAIADMICCETFEQALQVVRSSASSGGPKAVRSMRSD